MIDADLLVKELKAEVLELEADLRERITLPQFHDEWVREYDAAIRGDRTAATFTAWADDRVTQAAVTWVLTSVFVRFCEDNRLLAPVWISGPPHRRQEALDAQLAYFRSHPEDTDREWLGQAVAHLARTPATAGLVDDQAMLHTVSPSGQAITRLLSFWRRRDEAGGLVHDFTDADLDTRFLGDLYQDLSDHAKKTYALLQTPEFVEEFILDRTLTPALDDRSLEGFRMIDPACGSGHFLLGSFQRILSRWDAEAPALGRRERVQKALDAVWGVDLNAFAVAIAIFRLTVAALQAVGETSLERGLGFGIHVLVGDSLWFSHDQDSLFRADDDFAYSTEHKKELQKALTRGQYDAVVANPPYITVKDKKLNQGYRERYNHLKGKYQLTAPFMELLFKLAKRGGDSTAAGWVGQITSNAFMKREFGVPMIEDLLAKLDLRLVIDTSGAYIPGHGTPTLILVGRNQATTTQPVRSILGIRGEPGNPPAPAKGLVWSSIVHNVDRTGFRDSWVSVEDVDRQRFSTHPWSLTGGGAAGLVEQLTSGRNALAHRVRRIGFFGILGSDPAMLAPIASARRSRLEQSASRRFAAGEDVRDFAIGVDLLAWFPYDRTHKYVDSPEIFRYWWRHLWPNRTSLGQRPTFSGLSYFASGRAWWSWHQLPADADCSSQALVYANVATHNHFSGSSQSTVW